MKHRCLWTQGDCPLVGLMILFIFSTIIFKEYFTNH